VDSANKTWKLLIENYENTGEINGRELPKIIPPHNSNVDFTLKLSGYGVDTATFSDGTTKTVTGSVSDTYDIDVIVKGIADEVADNEIYQQDIVTSTDANSGDLTVTLDPSKSGKYSDVVEEDGSHNDAANTLTGAMFNLRDIYKTPDKINSYDNLKTNDADQSQIDTTQTDPNAASDDIASENLSISIENLGDDFDVHGATLVGGNGISRVWVTTQADIDAGNVTITTKEHYSGEVNFDIKYITTEDDGDTKTSPVQNVSLLVTPEAEGITNILQATTDVNEDVFTKMTFSTTTTLPDSDEYVSSLGIARTDYYVSGHDFKGVDGADFTIYLVDQNGNRVSLTDAVSNGDTRVSIETLIDDNGNNIDFYKIEDRADWSNLHVLYDPDIGGNEVNPSVEHQTTFGFKFDVSDEAQAVQNGSTVDLIDTEIGFMNSANYTFNLSPVTDDITADAHDGDITDIDGDSMNDISVSGHDVTIYHDTTINVAIKIDGVDTAGEEKPDGTTPNGLDADRSEQVRHIRVEGVPDGIGIVDGKFIGNVSEQPDTGIWLVDLQNPIEMDGTTQTYDLKFKVDNNYANATAPNPTDIHISVINQEYDLNGTPQSIAETGDFTLTFHRDPTFSGDTTDAPMDIIGVTDVNGDGVVDEQDGYTVDPAFQNNGGFKEDTAVKLGEIIHLDMNDVQGSLNQEENQNINSDLFSITVEGLDPAVATTNAAPKPTTIGMTTGWHIETVTDSNGITKEIITYRGAGTEADIKAALDLLEITPVQDRNHNNLGTIGGNDLNFTTTLTTYTQSGVKDVVSTDFSGDIKPVTDPVTATPTHTDATEDVTKSITFQLDTVDNSFGTPYATIVQNAAGDPIQTISVTYTGSSDVGYGQFGVTLGGVHFDPGETKDVPVTVSGNSVTLDFIADSNESGQAHFTYEIFSKELNADNVVQAQNSLDIDIAPVADGINTGGDAKAEGKEDTFIQILDHNGQPITGDLIDNSNNNTTPETLNTIAIGDVPSGWLIYYGSSKTLAQNLGDNGSGKNNWNIPLGSGANPVPEIYVKPLAQEGGVTETFRLITGVEDGGQQVYSSVPIDVRVEAVADPITINPSDIGGVEGNEISLNFNSNSPDVDGSEVYEIQLKNVGENAVFYFHGLELGSSTVHYDRATDTYTISKDLGIDYSTIDDLKVVQTDMTDQTIETKVIVQDSQAVILDPNNPPGTTETTGQFKLNITQKYGTSGDDTLLYDKKGVDGADGDDTVIFGTDWDGHYDGVNDLIDLSVLKNIEKFDLKAHGDHTVVLQTTDVENMTDMRNTLSVDTDNGDKVVLTNDGDNVWVKNTSTGVWENTNGAILNITGSGATDSSAVETGTGGDDVLGYYFDINNPETIDMGAGNDRLILFNDIDFQGGQFSKIKNVEVLDLTKPNGDIKLDNIKVDDIQSITNSSAGAVTVLTIESDSGADVVNLSSEWIYNTTSGQYEHTDSASGNLDAAIKVNGGATVTTSSSVIDGMVAGLRYMTSSGIIGVTTAAGSFDYAFGDTVTFMLGNVEIGSIDMEKHKDDKVFLQDLAGTERTDLDDAYVENMAVLLQSLDSDESERIIITEEMHEAFSDESFDLASISEEALVAVIEETGKEAVSEENAMEHVEDMLVKYTSLEEEDFETEPDIAKEETEEVLVLNEEEGIDMSMLDEESSSEKETFTSETKTENVDMNEEDRVQDESREDDEKEAMEVEETTKDVEDDVEENDVTVETEIETESTDGEIKEETKDDDTLVLEDVLETEEAAVEDENLDNILPESDTSSAVNTESVAETATEPESSSDTTFASAVDPTVEVTVDDQVPEVA